MARFSFYFSSIALVSALLFVAGVYTAEKETFPYRPMKAIYSDIKAVYRELTNLNARPIHWTSLKRYAGNGVTINHTKAEQNEFILLQGLFDDRLEIRLIDRSGRLMQRWPLQPMRIIDKLTHLHNRPLTPWHVNMRGAIILPDGSVLATLSQITLIKLDRCGKLLWLLDKPAHHSIERNDDGSLWVPSARQHNDSSQLTTKLFEPPYSEDILIKIDADGRIIEEISLVEVFVKNNAYGLLTMTGGGKPTPFPTIRPNSRQSIFHLNDVEALPAALADDFSLFKAGDLLVSLRNRNLLMVIDPASKSIKWWAAYPWIRQHDPDWVKGGLIRVFDNHRDGTDNGSILGGSRIVEINPVNGATTILYSGNQETPFYTKWGGEQQSLEDGRIIITEAKAGRVFEIDANKDIIWEYINAYDDHHNGDIRFARAYRQDYFTISDWSCP